MRPVLFHLGALPVHSYGVMLVLAFAGGTAIGMREYRRGGGDPWKIFDLSFWMILGAWIGSRALHVGVHWRDYAANPWDVLRVWEGGYTFYGGWILSFAFAYGFARWNGLGFAPILDASGPATLFGAAIGRVGCFLNGCCHGRPAAVPWALRFPDREIPGAFGPPVHPTQLYESGAYFAGFLVVLAFRRKRRAPGAVFALSVLGYAGARGLIEFLRGDPRGFVTIAGARVSEGQIVSLVIGALALVVLAVRRRREAPGARRAVV